MVAALGDGVDGSTAVGQRVVAPTHFGGYAERAVAQADGVVAASRTRSTSRPAAAIPITYVTAWEALVRARRPAARRARAHPRRRRRRRHRRDAARQAARRRGLGHRVAGQARGDPWLWRRPPNRLHPREDGHRGRCPPLDVILDSVGGASWRRSYKQLRAGAGVCFGAASGWRAAAQRVPPDGWWRDAAVHVLQADGGSPRAVLGLKCRVWDEFGRRHGGAADQREYLADGTIRPVLALGIRIRAAATRTGS